MGLLLEHYASVHYNIILFAHSLRLLCIIKLHYMYLVVSLGKVVLRFTVLSSRGKGVTGKKDLDYKHTLPAS